MSRPCVAAPVLVLCAALGARAAPAAADDDYPPLSIYGMVRLDAIVDDSTMSDARAPMWVEREPGGSDGEMTVHPRLSRLGVALEPWEVSDHWSGTGQLEVDFAGGEPDDEVGLRLREAVATLAWRDKLELQLGQTWDLASPLIPSVNAETMMWNAGNTGDRRPQLRVALSADGIIWLSAAVGQTGAVDRQDLDADGRLDGVEAGLPTVQGMIEWRRRGTGRARVGVWGHAAREQLASGRDLASRAVGAHLFLPFARMGVLMLEAYRGRNLDDLRGGIGQGINPVRMTTITATGGWVEAAVVLSRRHLVAFGETIDHVDPDDVEVGDRITNAAGYAVLRYRPRTAVELAFEYSYWLTQYKPAMDAEPGRGTASRFNLNASVSF